MSVDDRGDARAQAHRAVDALTDEQVAELGEKLPSLRGRPVFSKGPIIRALELLDAVVLLAVIALVAVALVKFGQQQDRTHKLAQQAAALAHANARLAQSNHRVAMQAKRLATQFQQQRLNNIRAGCVTQNAKLSVTTRRLDRVLRKRVAAGEVTKAQAGVLRTENLFLLTAIVPHQNCGALVKRAQRTGQAPIATVEPPAHS